DALQQRGGTSQDGLQPTALLDRGQSPATASLRRPAASDSAAVRSLLGKHRPAIEAENGRCGATASHRKRPGTHGKYPQLDCGNGRRRTRIVAAAQERVGKASSADSTDRAR